MTFSRDIAARTLYGECRGEPEEGQRAVAAVLVNRVKDGRWGPNLAAVCLAPAQFSCWGSKDPNRMILARLPDDDPMLLRLATIVNRAATGADSDPTRGALFYYADSIDPPPWASEMIETVKIGHHIFMKERK